MENDDEDCEGRFEGETEEEVDASLQQALMIALKASEERDVKKKSTTTSRPSQHGISEGDQDPDPLVELGDVKWTTTHVGVFRDLWIEKRYDSAQGKWKAKIEQNRLATLPPSQEGDDEGTFGADSSADELVREIARLRRKLRGQQQERKLGDDMDPDDVEIGYGPDVLTEPTEHDEGRQAAARPGAFRVRGSGEDGEVDSDDDAVPPPPEVSTSMLQPSTLASQRSDAVLLEANLVVEREEGYEALLVKAEPIRRRRQALAVAGLVALTAIIVGATTGAILSQPDPPPTPDYAFVNVSSMLEEFNASLPNSTVDAIDRDLTPQAEAYNWLFGSKGHPSLPKTEAVSRLLHRFALATLFYATGGNESWKAVTNWLDRDEHECLWYGVACTNGTSDALGSCKKEFDIPSVSCWIQDVTLIEGLDLSGNGLKRSLPAEIGLLSTSGIMRLKLESNSLEGTIPSEINQLLSLRTLSLIRNRLDGTIQSTIGDLSNLETLFLSQNSLSGVFPVSLTNLVKLKDLDFSSNSLVETIPSQIARMTSLVTLALSGNALSGLIPPEISELTSLTALELSGTDLSALFVDGIGTALRSLQLLALSGRKIFKSSSTIPTQIGEFVSLTRLEIFSSSFSGSIPSELGQLENLEYLLCNDNELTGAIPTELGNLRDLIVWNTGDNSMMTGPIPSALANLASLEEFVVAGNGHNGTIPPEFGNLSALTLLDTSHNSLSGPVPSELGRLATLKELFVDGTFYVGSHQLLRSPDA
jgi:Leucine-rich repeat (LRR) protein